MGDNGEGAIRYYYLIKANWVPNDPEETFLPFVTHLISLYKESTFTCEDFSNEFGRTFGFNLTMSILNKCLKKLIKKNVLSKSGNTFAITKRESIGNVESNATIFEEKYRSLIDGFLTFISPRKMTFDDAKKVVDDFCSLQELDPATYQQSSNALSVPAGINYQFAAYIKQLSKTDVELFGFIAQLCEAHLIKNFLCMPAETSIIKGKTIYIDGPILVKLLGYNGSYFQKEYGSIIKELQNHGNSIKIFPNTENEVLGILRDAQKMIGQVTGNAFFEAPADVYFFVENDKTSEDVELEIQNFHKNIASIGVQVDYKEINHQKSKNVVQNENEIEKAIIAQYRSTNPEYQVNTEQINCDVTSVSNIYIRRGNNCIRSFNDLGCFFLTNNNGLFNAIKTYNSQKYPETMSPVAHISFIGLIVSLENLVTSEKMMEDRVLAYCYSVYRPTQKVLDHFRLLLEEKHRSGEISYDDYVLLRSGKYLWSALADSTSNDPDAITEDTFNDVLQREKAQIGKKQSEEYAKALSDQKTSYEKDLLAQKEKHQGEIEALLKTKEEAVQKLTEKQYSRNLALAQEEVDKIKRLHNGITIAIAVILLLGTLITSIISLIQQWSSPFRIVLLVCDLLSLTYFIVSIIRSVKKKELVHFRMESKTAKIAKKYQVSEHDLR